MPHPQKRTSTCACTCTHTHTHTHAQLHISITHFKSEDEGTLPTWTARQSSLWTKLSLYFNIKGKLFSVPSSRPLCLVVALRQCKVQDSLITTQTITTRDHHNMTKLQILSEVSLPVGVVPYLLPRCQETHCWVLHEQMQKILMRMNFRELTLFCSWTHHIPTSRDFAQPALAGA